MDRITVETPSGSVIAAKGHRIKAWFDQERKEYKLFLPDGQLFPFVIDYDIQQRRNEMPTATFVALIDIVNERPDAQS